MDGEIAARRSGTGRSRAWLKNAAQLVGAARPYTRHGLLILTHVAAGVLGAWAVYRSPEPPAPAVHQWGPIELRDPIRTPAAEYEWRHLPAPEFPIPAYARFLQGTTIVLDPGHGGFRRNRPDPNVGPNGVREAEVNLAVALYLREFLETAGAKVHLTRDRDVYLHENLQKDLAIRIAEANRLPADLFVSLHHNAAANPDSNYSLIFYHADGQDSPASLCAARHILTGLNDTLRLSRHVDYAVRSDFTNSRDDGYAVLRQAHVPAVLVEASFHTNPEEADRLKDPVYNRLEAYGIFIGLARWAQAGLPAISLVDQDEKTGSKAGVVIQLHDGLRDRGSGGPAMQTILPDTIRVELNGKRQQAAYDVKSQRLTLPLRLEELRGGRLFVDFQNVMGQHVIHPVLYFR